MDQSLEQTPYTILGGETGVRALVERFYQLMDQGAQYASIRAMHKADLSHVKIALFEFLSGWLGGPALYFKNPEHRCVISSHFRFPIGGKETAQWLACMDQALKEFNIPKELSERLGDAFSSLADKMRTKS